MPPQRALRAVAHNFLGAYASRSSEHDGYWLFGFLVPDLLPLEVELLGPAAAGASALVREAAALAAAQFQEQLRKARLDAGRVERATLRIELAPAAVLVPPPLRADARAVRFAATVIARSGKRFHAERLALVAPHDPKLEQRSARAPRH